MFAEWNWLAFVLGVLAGTLAMWIASVLAMTKDAERNDEDAGGRWR